MSNYSLRLCACDLPEGSHVHTTGETCICHGDHHAFVDSGQTLYTIDRVLFSKKEARRTGGQVCPTCKGSGVIHE